MRYILPFAKDDRIRLVIDVSLNIDVREEGSSDRPRTYADGHVNIEFWLLAPPDCIAGPDGRKMLDEAAARAQFTETGVFLKRHESFDDFMSKRMGTYDGPRRHV